MTSPGNGLIVNDRISGFKMINGFFYWLVGLKGVRCPQHSPLNDDDYL